MDRRRYVPATEGLEGRALLSLFGNSASNYYNLYNNPAADVPFTFSQKERRIEHLPFYLDKLQPGRFLSKSTLTAVQDDLQSIMGHLNPVPPQVLTNYNHLLRSITPHPSLTVGSAHGLNRAFGSVLQHAGATPTEVASFQANMLKMAQADTQSPNPVYLATNDYSVVLQDALGIGHPLKRPESAPLLVARDGVRSKATGVTANPEPTLVGNYAAGGVVDAGTTIQLIDGSGNVVGSGPLITTGKSPVNGKYSIKIETPLSPGRHVFRARAMVNGLSSLTSPAVIIKVVAPHDHTAQETLSSPAGPLGLK